MSVQVEMLDVIKFAATLAAHSYVTVSLAIALQRTEPAKVK